MKRAGLGLLLSASLMLVLAGCRSDGSDDATAGARNVASATFAPCPSPRDADFTGRFTEDCVRQFVTWRFRLPVTSAYEPPVFQFNPKHPEELVASYYPLRHGDARLRLDMFPLGGPNPFRSDDITSPGGHDVSVGPSAFGFAGVWEDDAASYGLTLLGVGDSPESRSLIAAMADSVLDNVSTDVSSIPTVEPTSVESVLGTPIPRESVHSITLMFCEPLREVGGAGTKVAVVDEGVDVVYESGGCEPDVDATGAVAVRNRDGTIHRVMVAYASPQVSASRIVWTPAKGILNGQAVVMTGKFISQDASVWFDSSGSGPVLRMNLTNDGRQVFGTLSERLVGYPLAAFVDGAPERGAHGEMIAPTIASQITDTLATVGLTLPDAKQLAATINFGLAK